MNIARDLVKTFPDSPKFTFLWMNTFSHNDFNTPSSMDDKVLDFLKDLSTYGVYDNTFVLFLSDHGIRYGDYRKTTPGWFEERLPYFYMAFPREFQKKYPEKYNNFKENCDKFTTPFDVYMTIQDILVISGKNYTIKPSEGCPNCKSLFEKIDFDKHCLNSGVDKQWCTCVPHDEISLRKIDLLKLIIFVTKQLNNIVTENTLCRKYKFNKTVSISSYKLEHKYLIISFETYPKALFEATVRKKSDNFILSGNISRIDLYGNTSSCIADAHLRKYCYCR